MKRIETRQPLIFTVFNPHDEFLKNVNILESNIDHHKLQPIITFDSAECKMKDFLFDLKKTPFIGEVIEFRSSSKVRKKKFSFNIGSKTSEIEINRPITLIAEPKLRVGNDNLFKFYGKFSMTSVTKIVIPCIEPKETIKTFIYPSVQIFYEIGPFNGIKITKNPTNMSNEKNAENRAEALEKIKELLNEKGHSIEELSEEMTFDQLAIDSIDAMELCQDMEEKLHASIPDEKMVSWKTIADVVNTYLEHQ